MANIFRSKEVYKKVSKQESSYDHDVLIPVGEPFKANSEYGIYVAGEYRPPYYTDGLTISSISSTRATVVDYTSNYEYPSAGESSFIYDFDVSDSLFSIERFEKIYIDLPPDEGSIIYDFDVSSSIFDIDRFEKDYEYPPADEGVFVYDFDTLINTVHVEQGRWFDYLVNQPEPGMQLESITSDPVTVTDAL